MNNDFNKRYLEARRKVIETDFAGLNPMQRKAVMATEGALLILAGAGSGKTTVLINRIANLMRYGKAGDCEEIPENAGIEDIDAMARLDDEARRTAAFEPVEPWRILAITFTNKAANELKTRLSKMLGEAGADVWASTFHSACVRILRRDADRLGFTSSFTIYDSSDSQSLIKHILRDFDLDDKKYPPRMLLSEISRAKDDCCSPEQYYARAKATGDARRVKIAEIYAEYSRRAFAAGAMDFDDLIYYTVKLLNENEDVCQYWQKRFKYILIDEYQDTNKLQYMLASKLAEGWGNICVVGDDGPRAFTNSAVQRSRTYFRSRTSTRAAASSALSRTTAARDISSARQTPLSKTTSAVRARSCGQRVTWVKSPSFMLPITSTMRRALLRPRYSDCTAKARPGAITRCFTA